MSEIQESLLTNPPSTFSANEDSSSPLRLPQKRQREVELQENPLPTFEEAYSNNRMFIKLVKEYFKQKIDPSLHFKIKEIVNQKEYLFQLLKETSTRGGWRRMNACHGWHQIASLFGNLSPEQLRKDYDEHLFIIEKGLSPLTKYDNSTIENYLEELNPELMQQAVLIRPSKFDTSLTAKQWNSYVFSSFGLARGYSTYILNIDISVFKIDRITNVYSNNPITIKIENDPKETWYKDITLGGFLDELLTSNNPKIVAEADLKEFSALYEELSKKLPNALHWNSKNNLLRYYPKLLGITSPMLLILNNNFIFTGGPSYLNSSGVYLNFDTTIEWWAIDSKQFPVLQQKVLRDFSIDISKEKWLPNDQYLLVQNIPFWHTTQRPGDIIFAPNDKVYWITSVLKTTLIYWNLLSDSPLSLEDAWTIHKSNFSKEYPKKINLPRLVVEYLNRELGKISQSTFEFCKEMINECTESQELPNKTRPEDSDCLFCAFCGKDIIWKYSRCIKCHMNRGIDAICLSCTTGHKCLEIVFFEKYPEEEWKAFLARINAPQVESFQEKICRTEINEFCGCGENIAISPSTVEAIYNAPLINAHIQIEAVDDPEEVEQNCEDKVVAPIKMPDINDLYKNKGKKQRDIRKAMENPLSGPRFTYQLEEKEYQSKAKDDGNDILKNLMKGRNNESALSSLVKKPSSISGLSRLISKAKTDKQNVYDKY
ncbi:unnamed protein product [Blepharisma stoltei]|uniref:ARID domain-containing protein n=1 Tax=Blepharisma stoltei TaxID=1481888 RepID=A0AAU9IP09_9CILI|nr:unnamed protein product [Blepharisma stoltei]